MYATQADIVTLYGIDALFVADRNGDGQVDEPSVDRAIRSASAEIDTYLRRRYPLPLAEPDEILTQYCVDIALYRLALSTDVATENHKERYNAAIKALLWLAEGKTSLDVPAPAEGEEAAAAGNGPNPIVTGGPERLFSREKTRDL